MHIQGGKGEKIQSSLVVQKPSLFSTPLLELSTKGAAAAAARCSARNYENSFPNNKCSQLPVTKFHHHPSCHLREKQFVLNVEGWGGRGKKHLWSLSVSRKGSAKFEFFDSSFPKLSRISRPRRRAKRKRGEGPKKLGACGGGRRGNGCARKQWAQFFGARTHPRLLLASRRGATEAAEAWWWSSVKRFFGGNLVGVFLATMIRVCLPSRRV